MQTSQWSMKEHCVLLQNLFVEMGVFMKIWQRNEFLLVNLFGCLNIAFAVLDETVLEETEAVTDSDSIVPAAIIYLPNLLLLIHNHECGLDAWNTKTKR